MPGLKMKPATSTEAQRLQADSTRADEVPARPRASLLRLVTESASKPDPDIMLGTGSVGAQLPEDPSRGARSSDSVRRALSAERSDLLSARRQGPLSPEDACYLESIDVELDRLDEAELRVADERDRPLLHQHDALEEAIATGHVLLEACRRAGRSVDDVLEEVGTPGTATFAPGDGPLGGETIVFTGALVMVRSDAAQIAEESGATAGKGVTKATTVLVVGDQDLRLVGDDGKSNKHEKAEKLIAGGQRIRIIGESDFFALVKP